MWNETMQHEIIYKNVRHGYAKISNWKLNITIPQYLKNNENFKNQLLEKSKKLIEKYNKKNHIQTLWDNFVILFGEKVKSSFKNQKDIQKFLCDTLHDYAKPLIDKYSDLLWINYKKIIIRKTRSKWWSCTGDQKISLNLNLIHLPTKFVRYVIVHEICHLKYKNHSKKFRDLVAEIYPNYKSVRKEMRNLELSW